jgi:IS605 OrfB family transposase
MVNQSIAIGLETGRTSLKMLSLASYRQLKIFGTRSRYRLCAISRASGILKNYRSLSKKHRVKIPYCQRLGLTICYGLKVKDGMLTIPGGYSVQLNSHVVSTLNGPDIEIRSATLTLSRLSISYSRDVELIAPEGAIGVDNNLDNVTAADSLGNILVHDISGANRVGTMARYTVARFRRDDHRVRRRIARKYGRIQRARTGWIMHNTTKRLVEYAREKKLYTVLENLKNIQRLYRRGNGQGRYYRGRMKAWSHHEIDRQLCYKLSWEGLPVGHVSPRGTSSCCSVCGDRLVFSKQSRTVYCPTCSIHMDRDVNAARRILHAGLRFSPLGLSGEAVKGNPTTMVIPRVDDSQRSSRMLATEQPRT